MSQKERLKKLIAEGQICPGEAYCITCKYLSDGDCDTTRLADYLLEKGVIIPPVKIGQTVYVITKTDIRAYKVHTIVVGDAYHKCYFFAEWYYDSLALHNADFDFADVGKTVFLTKEEAQKVLEEREEDNG